MSLKPLMDRLKRTDAPTVEEVATREWWWLRNELFETLVSLKIHCVDEIHVYRAGRYCGPIGSVPGEWRPVLSPAEQDAIAALPLKVVEMAIEMSGDAVIGEATDPGAEEYNDGLLDASRAVRRLIPAAIVDECAK